MSCCQWMKNLFRRRNYEDMGGENQTEIQVVVLENRIHMLESRLDEETAAKDKALKSKEEALRRLSEHVALKLSDDNPDIVDLSDVNRPDCLAEKFSELYDNEWTNAFEFLHVTAGFEDVKAIKQLLYIVMESFRICREKSSTQMTLILRACDIDLEAVSAATKKVIKDTKKKIAFESLPVLRKETRSCFANKDNKCEELLTEEAMQCYIDRCTEICWLMAVQDPPMALSKAIGENGLFDKFKYREFMNSGQFVDYIVWPGVLIQDGGMLLSKGVAQCCDSLDKENKQQ